MKMFKTTVFLCIVTVLFSSGAVEAKAEAKISAAKPFQAEQNLKLYQKSMETTQLDHQEGSGDDYVDDYDEDDDDDYYYDDDDEYSGDDDWLESDPADVEAELIPDHDHSDFHFKEDHVAKDEDIDDDDLLYEYNNEYYYEEDYLDQVEQDLESSNDADDEVIVTVKQDDPISNGDPIKYIFQPSYIFLMLTSALISFAIFILAFILCRRSVQRQHKKNHMVPFVVSSRDFTSTTATSSSKYSSSSPIVKNYQRVPTSTKELMQHSSVVEMQMNQNQSERPLLDRLT